MFNQEVKQLFKYNTQGTCEVLNVIAKIKEGYITDKVAGATAVVMLPKKFVGKMWYTSKEDARLAIHKDLTNMLDYYEKAIAKIEKSK